MNRGFWLAERLLFTAILISTITFMTLLAYGEADWANIARNTAIGVMASSFSSLVLVRMIRRG